ncbi:MAG: STAS domain-containing protein [candidate division KSB1 bacterium]|nr:STAS domain-containing protein [candidate division KSB1 bacterium]MDZ7345367.1 STAS domain-containing protein [candidate division KSB1 bacterium]
MSLNIQTKMQSGAAIVHIEGEVDMFSSPEARRAIMELIRKKTPKIIVELEGVPYMDSSGLAVLIEGLRQCGEYGGSLAVAGVRDNVREVFELTRLDRVFKIYQNVEAALAE